MCNLKASCAGATCWSFCCSSPTAIMWYRTVLFLLAIAYTHAIMFEVRPGIRKCVAEEFRYDTLVSGSYEVSDKLARNPSFPYEIITRSFQMEFVIEGPNGIIVDHKGDAKTGSFAFHTEQEGVYQFCFIDNNRPGSPPLQIPSRTVSINMKSGVEARDYDEVAKKENLKPLELELLKLEDASAKIKDDMLYMKQREEEMRDTNESTNSRVVWLTIFSTIILVVSAIFQLLYLKRYFQVKKLI